MSKNINKKENVSNNDICKNIEQNLLGRVKQNISDKIQNIKVSDTLDKVKKNLSESVQNIKTSETFTKIKNSLLEDSSNLERINQVQENNTADRTISLLNDVNCDVRNNTIKKINMSDQFFKYHNALKTRLKVEESLEVISSLLKTISLCRDYADLYEVTEFLEHKESSIRCSALEAVNNYEGDFKEEIFIDFLEDKNSKVKDTALKLLKNNQTDIECIQKLEKQLHSDDPTTILSTLNLLKYFASNEEALNLICLCIQSEEKFLYEKARDILIELNEVKTINILRNQLEQNDTNLFLITFLIRKILIETKPNNYEDVLEEMKLLEEEFHLLEKENIDLSEMSISDLFSMLNNGEHDISKVLNEIFNRNLTTLIKMKLKKFANENQDKEICRKIHNSLKENINLFNTNNSGANNTKNACKKSVPSKRIPKQFVKENDNKTNIKYTPNPLYFIEDGSLTLSICTGIILFIGFFYNVMPGCLIILCSSYFVGYTLSSESDDKISYITNVPLFPDDLENREIKINIYVSLCILLWAVYFPLYLYRISSKSFIEKPNSVENNKTANLLFTIGTGIIVFSFFLPWMTIGLVNNSLFNIITQQGGNIEWILLFITNIVSTAISLYALSNNQIFVKFHGFIAIWNILEIIFGLNHNGANVLGINISLNGSGLIIYIIGIIIFFAGFFKIKK